MGAGGVLGLIPGWVRGPVIGVVNDIDPARRWISSKVINGYARRTPPRPRAVSMHADYVTWPGLTDKRWSGRHLGRIEGDKAPAQPDVDEVVKLFERKTFRPAEDTSVLFPMFAQWFVDSFLRTKWEPGPERRFAENESNHEIDLCQIYGMSEVQTSMLRDPADRSRLRTQTLNGETWPGPLFEPQQDGQLALGSSFRWRPGAGEDQPPIPGLYTAANFRRVFDGWSDEDKRHAFTVGLEHGNSTLGNSVMNTLFVREHNRTAGIIAAAHPGWDADRVFQTARNTTIAVLLNIVISDYIVHIAPIDVQLEAIPGMAEKEPWYRNNWMAVEFALLYRWHDLVPDQLVVGGDVLPAAGMRRANRWLVDHGLEAVLLAASRQPAGRIGLGNTAKFLLDPHPHGADVKRLSIRMARACGLPSFNSYRRHYGMKPVASFEALTRNDAALSAELKRLYGHIDRLEWWVGLFAEAYGKGEMMGELLTTMVANDAFTQALTNPLLAEAVFNADTFSPEGLKIVKETRTLAQVIERNTRLKKEQVGFKRLN